jgi:isoleucyl-tRNA synthetase
MQKAEEDKIKHFWEQKKIYEKIKKSGKKFYFLDGPPYATGYIHMGTAWNKILKDSYIRFWRMNGLWVWDQPGYDTHGLPIENQVEKQLGTKTKSDIERLGIAKFVEECRTYATKFIGIMNEQFNDLGVWMDWDNPYLTLSREYIEGAWATFKIAFEKGLLYRGLYPVHVCPRCETAVAYNEIEYGKADDPAVYVKFPVKGEENTYFVIWTTTPWTLPANTGIMAKPSAEYVKVKVMGEFLIVAKELLESVMSKAEISHYEIVKTMKGKDLKDKEFDHPLKDIFKFQENVKHRIVLSDQFVELETGTGLVHTAPGHGQEDYKVGTEAGLAIISPVKLNGRYNEECGRFADVFVKDADRQIIEIMKERDMLLAEEKINHDYPFCWRCRSPLLEMSVSQWFFKVTQIRNKLIKENSKVKWHPEWAGQRFHNWLNSLGDWPISRQRYWGIPLPIWICECGEVKIIGSSSELPVKIKDLHRPYIDEIKLPCKCGLEMKRINDVLDVWFDSGLASWSSLGYPEKHEPFKKLWPADLNIEGPDQIRGWWNSQLITSVITFDRAPFKDILLHGFVLDAHGSKMSKSKGNIVSAEEVVKKYGRDVLRLYLLSSPQWDDFYFKWEDVESIAKSFVIIENSFRYVNSYAKKGKKPKSLQPEDEWILSRLNSVVDEATKSFKTYNIHKAASTITEFILNDFSRHYIKIIRDRVWPTYEGTDKAAAEYALITVAETVTKMLAPFCPFFTEKIYQENGKKESVHLENWPKSDKKMIKEKLEKEMEIVKEIIEVANAIRKENNVKIRWPLEYITVESEDTETKDAIKTFGQVILGMANTKQISGQKDGYKKEFSKGAVYLSRNILKREAILRELLREIQAQRKRQNLNINDKIMLYISDPSLREFENDITAKVGAKETVFGADEDKMRMCSMGGISSTVTIEDVTVAFCFEAVR